MILPKCSFSLSLLYLEIKRNFLLWPLKLSPFLLIFLAIANFEFGNPRSAISLKTIYIVEKHQKIMLTSLYVFRLILR